MTVRRALVLLSTSLLLLLTGAIAASAQTINFADTAGTPHEEAVSALAALDIVRGCEAERFCSRDPLTRGQTATIIVNAIDLPPVDSQAAVTFGDIATDTHRAAIEVAGTAGIMLGCAEDRFCPKDLISRAELATTLQRAFDLGDAPEGQRYFHDVDGTHAPAVRSITAAGISSGCDLVRFCPQDHLKRAHAAVFIARALGLVDLAELAPLEQRAGQHQERQEELAEERRIAAAEEEAAAPGRRALEVAMAQIGKPYAWGGSGPNRFDCSGLTSFAWAAAGTDLPRTSRSQYTATTRISRSDLMPGDLVFYHSPISHVAMYIGDGRVVEAPGRGGSVRIRSDGLTRSGIVGYGRP